MTLRSNEVVAVSDEDLDALVAQAADLVETWFPGTSISHQVDLPWSGGEPDERIAYISGASIWLRLDDDLAWTLFRLVDGLDQLSESAQEWGNAYPPCVDGHAHPAHVDLERGVVVIDCPVTGEVLHRLTPRRP